MECFLKFISTRWALHLLHSRSRRLPTGKDPGSTLWQGTHQVAICGLLAWHPPGDPCLFTTALVPRKVWLSLLSSIEGAHLSTTKRTTGYPDWALAKLLTRVAAIIAPLQLPWVCQTMLSTLALFPGLSPTALAHICLECYEAAPDLSYPCARGKARFFSLVNTWAVQQLSLAAHLWSGISRCAY
jgi:hypothetical protein